ncbi:YadA-like family protein [Burkholderia sp. BKH01]|uniref:YadA-like family protein n=1 Tax=Burkholderia sp. BKH01 TaxID=2769262 RepID=UPI00398C22C6
MQEHAQQSPALIPFPPPPPPPPVSASSTKVPSSAPPDGYAFPQPMPASQHVASPRPLPSAESTQPDPSRLISSHESTSPLHEDSVQSPAASQHVASPRPLPSAESTQPDPNRPTSSQESTSPRHEDSVQSPAASQLVAPTATSPEDAQQGPFLLQAPPLVPARPKKVPSSEAPVSYAPAQPMVVQLTTPASQSAKYIAVNSVLPAADASGLNAIAIGANARAQGEESLAIGWRARADGSRSVATGAEATASGHNSVALGAGSVADRDNTVSVGQLGNERQIAHVAPGTQGKDAVNVDQLNFAVSNSNAYTNQRIGDLQQSITDTARDAYSGVAAATALTMIPDVDLGKTLSIGIGGAVYKGHRAVALGATARASENLKLRAGVAMSEGGNAVGVGMSWQW